MILYSIIIFVMSAIIILLNLLFSSISPLFLIFGTIIGVALSIVIDICVALLVRAFDKKINPFAKIFHEGKNERKIYNFFRIKSWKDKIPELGKTLKFFDKTKVCEKPNAEYFLMFLRETCVAEVMHVLIIPFAFLIIPIYPIKYLSMTLPIAIVNVFLQILPICVQRFNRPKLLAGYKRMSKYETSEEKNV